MHEDIFVRKFAEIRQLVAIAVLGAGDDVRKRASFRAGFFAVHEQPTVETLAALCIEESTGAGQVGGT